MASLAIMMWTARRRRLMVNVLGALGLEVDVHIPDRMREGYGPNEAALAALQARGAGLIVTVDCGIAAHGPLAAVADTGIDVIVVDHHLAGPELPRAHGVINRTAWMRTAPMAISARRA